MIDIIHEHEELINGSGFQGIERKRHQPLALVAGTVTPMIA
ncbi:MAG: hypothetical protein R2827_02130 [Bdellovibrionales bacterium]